MRVADWSNAAEGGPDPWGEQIVYRFRVVQLFSRQLVVNCRDKDDPGECTVFLSHTEAEQCPVFMPEMDQEL